MALTEIAEGIYVAESSVDATTTTVVKGSGDGCLVIDPAVTAAEITSLGNEIRGLGMRPVVGWSTHAHWDHLLWNSRALGAPPRYATAKTSQAATANRGKFASEVNRESPGHDLAAIGQVKPLPPGENLPWDGPTAEVIEHNGHSAGHGALWFADLGLLVAGDMLSDVEIPILDVEAANLWADYWTAIDRFAALEGVKHLVPGHGSPCGASAFLTRIVRDRVYLNDLAAGRKSIDPRLQGAPAWITKHHSDQIAAVAKSGAGLMTHEQLRAALP